jgi:hypothetical protein
MNVRIRHEYGNEEIDVFSVEALDSFFVDAYVEMFDEETEEWVAVEPDSVTGEIEQYNETGTFEQISISLIFEHPDGFFRLLQKCDAPPGTYYLKTTAVVGDITQIERLKIKAKINI